MRSLGLALVACLFLAGGAGAVPRKVIVAHNWDLLAVGTEDVWRNRTKFAAVGVDGILFPLDRMTPDGKSVRGRDVMTSGTFVESDFDASAAQARECLQLDGLRESLVLFALIPRTRLAWTNDAAWACASRNVAVLARVARAAGFRGLAIDHEDYTKQRQFRYEPTADPEYDATRELARRRGREFFGAFFGEFPDARILAFWLLSELDGIVASPYAAADVAGYGTLWIPFLDGMLDVLPPQAKIIDGNEDSGYKCDGFREKFRALAVATHFDAQELVSPENRPKYAGQISASFGQYFDSYIVSTNSRWYKGDLNGSRLNRLQRNLASAVDAADDLVWVYGEKGTLVDWDVKNDRRLEFPTWESNLPGLARTIRLAAGDRVAMRKMVADGIMTNLAEKMGMQRVAGKGYAVARVHGALKSGEIVHARVRVKGAWPKASIGWKTGDRFDWSKGQGWLDSAETDAQDWRLFEGRFVVPEGMDGLGLVMSAPLSSDENPVLFDDIGVFRIRE